jgi:hypothetical protein
MKLKIWLIKKFLINLIKNILTIIINRSKAEKLTKIMTLNKNNLNRNIIINNDNILIIKKKLTI